MTTTQNKYNTIAKRYSDALIEIINDGKLTYKKASSDLNLIESTLKQSADLDKFLTNPLISSADKKEIINRVFFEDVDAVIINFLKVLVDKDRFEAFGEIVVTYNEALDKINNLSRIQVTSAIELSEDTKNRLKNKLEAKLQKTVALDWEINSGIIAGLVIKMGDNVIDTSLKHKLEDLSKTITK